MAVSSIVFHALYWGVPIVVFGVMLAFAGIAKKKPMKLTWLIVGFLGASAYYTWFEFGVKTQTLTLYVAESCERGKVMYHLPFGEGVEVNFDVQPADPDDTWIGVQNLTTALLVIDENIYTQDGRAPTGGAHLDGYEIPAGETHGLTIATDNIYFLEPTPEVISDPKSGAQFHKYSVQCAN